MTYYYDDLFFSLLKQLGYKTAIITTKKDNRVAPKPKPPAPKKEKIPFEDNKVNYDIYAPIPTLIQKRGRATIVHWDDGTITKVVREEGQPDNAFHAFTAALAKRIYGSTNNVIQEIDFACEAPVEKGKKKHD